MSIKRLSALFIFSLIFLAASANATVYLYNETNISGSVDVNAYILKIAQGFDVSETINVVYAKLYIFAGTEPSYVNIYIARSYSSTPVSLVLKKVEIPANQRYIYITIKGELDPGHYYLIVESYEDTSANKLYPFGFYYADGNKDFYIYAINGSAYEWTSSTAHLTAVIYGEYLNTTGGAGNNNKVKDPLLDIHYDAGVIGAMIFIFLVFAVVVPAYEFRIKEYGAGLLSMFFGIFVTLAIYCYLLFMPLWTVIFALLAGGVLLIAYKHRRGLTDSLRW